MSAFADDLERCILRLACPGRASRTRRREDDPGGESMELKASGPVEMSDALATEPGQNLGEKAQYKYANTRESSTM